MYTIVMDDYKNLIATVKMRICQHEKLIDKLQFLLPQTYGDLDLSQFTVALKYIDNGNKAHIELLTRDEELYKERLRYTVPIDSALTVFSGDIDLRLTLTKIDPSIGTQYVLNTGPVTVHVDSIPDYYQFDPDTSMEIIDQMVTQLDSRIAELNALTEANFISKADNIIIDRDNKTLQLTSNDLPVGDAIALNDLGDEVADATTKGLVKVVL